jgi:phosphoribosyl 1,2-cyclic phosphodiesterase
LGINVEPKTGGPELTFLGTRGEIEARSRCHRRHSALLVQHGSARIMIDCGRDWLHRLGTIAPTAIVLTHAHADHAAGLAEGAPCPVYATEQTWALLHRYPIREKRKIRPRQAVTIGGVKLTAFPVEHSVRAPAVGYRLSAANHCVVYLPDVAALPDASDALGGADLYIGDGATVRRPMVRARNGSLIGHAAMTAQLTWCEQADVRRVIFTHCGSAIVRGDGRRMGAMVRRLGRERGIAASLACDGDRLVLGAMPPDARRGLPMLERPRQPVS